MPYRATPAIQARTAAQRATIVAAAIAVLTDEGYAGCSVAAVAARAGVATGTVYKHFTSKAELVAEVFQQVVSREVAAVAAAAALPGPLADRVVAVLETFARRALKVPKLAYALLAEPVDAQVDELRLGFRRTFQDLIAGTVAAGVAAGALPPQNARLTAAALVGAAGELLVGPLSVDEPPVDTVPALIGFTLRALGGAQAESAPGGSRDAADA
ncbi:MAG TPA: TetR/AcrR family transcriptional regulator [Pseudonocardiaceae bacterium]|nr:TetR/AcrR family transcriptional regulator [Pseudonocardiaceae bacterium]